VIRLRTLEVLNYVLQKDWHYGQRGAKAANCWESKGETPLGDE